LFELIELNFCLVWVDWIDWIDWIRLIELIELIELDPNPGVKTRVLGVKRGPDVASLPWFELGIQLNTRM